MAQKPIKYKRTASHSTTVLTSTELSESNHPILSASESVSRGPPAPISSISGPISSSPLKPIPSQHSMQDIIKPKLAPPHNPSASIHEHDRIRRMEEEEEEEEPSERKEHGVQNSNAISAAEFQEIRVFEPGYSQWKGSNRVFCKGRIIGGPEIWKLFTTATIIVIPSALYLSWTFSKRSHLIVLFVLLLSLYPYVLSTCSIAVNLFWFRVIDKHQYITTQISTHIIHHVVVICSNYIVQGYYGRTFQIDQR